MICRTVSLKFNYSGIIPDAADVARKREVEFYIDSIRI